ncbi:MAG: Nif11-like leader peptide family natural product precursor [Cyanobacteria bacterium P01_D01_bin.44]
MSKKNLLSFLSKASKDKQLKAQLQTTSTSDELVKAGNQAGYEFSSEHVDEVITELKQKPGFFGALAEAVVELFSPEHDDYPATGIQPFSGDSNPNP